MEPRKKLKTEKDALEARKAAEEDLRDKRVTITLTNPEGERLGTTLDIPVNTTHEALQEIVNQLVAENAAQKRAGAENAAGDDGPKIYSFFYEQNEIKTSIKDFIVNRLKNFSTENVLPIVYYPQALFFVRPITRQSSSLPGHTESVLSVQFSPDGERLASGAGDATVRFWDINTETPWKTGEGAHKNWVLCVQWSPDAKHLASGDMNGDVVLWDAATGERVGSPMKGHTKWVTSLAWEPAHKNAACDLLASSSKDATVRVWHVPSQRTLVVLSGHTQCVTKVVWGGEDHLYTASEDTTIKCWDKAGQLKRELKGHGHWVNTLCLHTDYALRTGAFDETKRNFADENEMQGAAAKRYAKIRGEAAVERLVSGSDDFSLILWHPARAAKPVARMTGHQQPVNHTQFSPDGRFVISASFDKSLRLWDGYSGAFMATLRGHVAPVYQIAWSPDSRLFVSGSKDSTMKVWDVKTKKLMFDLPGHADEVYSLDWAPDGSKVASGGKDRCLRIWKN